MTGAALGCFAPALDAVGVPTGRGFAEFETGNLTLDVTDAERMGLPMPTATR